MHLARRGRRRKVTRWNSDKQLDCVSLHGARLPPQNIYLSRRDISSVSAAENVEHPRWGLGREWNFSGACGPTIDLGDPWVAFDISNNQIP